MSYTALFNCYEDDYSTPVEGVLISIWNSGLTTLVTEITINGSGTAGTSLPAGTYKVFIYKEGYTAIGTFPKTYVVAANFTDTYIVKEVPNLAVPAKSCVFSGKVIKLDGSPLQGSKVYIELTNSPQVYNNESVIDRARYTLLTGLDGYFTQVFPGGMHITVTIPAAKFKASGYLPIEGRLNMLELDRV